MATLKCDCKCHETGEPCSKCYLPEEKGFFSSAFLEGYQQAMKTASQIAEEKGSKEAAVAIKDYAKKMEAFNGQASNSNT